MEIVKLTKGRDCKNPYTLRELEAVIGCSQVADNCEVCLITRCEETNAVHYVKLNSVVQQGDRLILEGHESAASLTTDAFSKFYNELLEQKETDNGRS